MLHKPFYDPQQSYENNYDHGPFAAFSTEKVYLNKAEASYDFLGKKIYLPFGIPAGPLLNSNYIKSAFQMGFDIAVYKTVRSAYYPCHAFPNILPLQVNDDLILEKIKDPIVTSTTFTDPLTITNSFGVPSKDPAVWQEDVKKALTYQNNGQLVILSFMGTVRENQTQQAFIEDYLLAARLAHETKAAVLEVNLSCPNIGNEGLVCYNSAVTKKILKGIRNVIENTPLVVKIGYFTSDKELATIAKIVNEYANDIAAINTLQAVVVTENGKQALPGNNRLRSGVCGKGIKWAGVEMVKRLAEIKKDNNYGFSITGVGGVFSKKDYNEYKKAGADCVMSATGAMWNPMLAQEIKQHID